MKDELVAFYADRVVVDEDGDAQRESAAPSNWQCRDTGLTFSQMGLMNNLRQAHGGAQRSRQRNLRAGSASSRQRQHRLQRRRADGQDVLELCDTASRYVLAAEHLSNPAHGKGKKNKKKTKGTGSVRGAQEKARAPSGRKAAAGQRGARALAGPRRPWNFGAGSRPRKSVDESAWRPHQVRRAPREQRLRPQSPVAGTESGANDSDASSINTRDEGWDGASSTSAATQTLPTEEHVSPVLDDTVVVDEQAATLEPK